VLLLFESNTVSCSLDFCCFLRFMTFPVSSMQTCHLTRLQLSSNSCLSSCLSSAAISFLSPFSSSCFQLLWHVIIIYVAARDPTTCSLRQTALIILLLSWILNKIHYYLFYLPNWFFSLSSKSTFLWLLIPFCLHVSGTDCRSVVVV